MSILFSAGSAGIPGSTRSYMLSPLSRLDNCQCSLLSRRALRAFVGARTQSCCFTGSRAGRIHHEHHLFSRQTPHPAGWLPDRQIFRGEESNLRPPDSKSSIAYQQRLPRSQHSIFKRPAGFEPARPPWQDSRLPLHHGRVHRIQVFKEQAKW